MSRAAPRELVDHLDDRAEVLYDDHARARRFGGHVRSSSGSDRALWQAGRTAEACGLALIVLGGLGPPSSYQANLLLAGAVLLALPWAAGAVCERDGHPPSARHRSTLRACV